MGSRRRRPVAEWAEYLSTPLEITRFYADYRAKAFVVHLGRRRLLFPFAMTDPQPNVNDRLAHAYTDEEHGQAAIWYVLQSGKKGLVQASDVLKFYREPSDLHDQILWKLTTAALENIEQTALSRRQIIQRLRTSPSQLYRLLDPMEIRKSVDGVLALLEVLGCEVEVTVRRKPPNQTANK